MSAPSQLAVPAHAASALSRPIPGMPQMFRMTAPGPSPGDDIRRIVISAGSSFS